MATTDFAPADRSVPFSVPHGIEALVRWVAHRRAASAKRAALQNLLHAPEHLLRDIGVTRHELIEAIQAHGK